VGTAAGLERDGVTARLAIGVALVAAAAAAAVLAVDVRTANRALRDGDAAYAAAPGHVSWRADATLGGSARSLLGIDADLRVRTALQLATAAHDSRLRLDNGVAVETLRARAQDALSRVANGSDRAAASQARTLLGILAFSSSANGGDQSGVDAALAAFTDAIRAAPSNPDPKYDLELLLRLTSVEGTRTGQGEGGGFGRGGRQGSGGGTPGRGY
jgi:hypothetical protein